MTGLATISRFVVPMRIAEETDLGLRAAGEHGAECFVLWSGVVHETMFHVRHAHVPKQTAYRLPDGLCVRVDGAELHQLNVWLLTHGEQLGIQVHSHPMEAYHSETDDTYPIATVRGSLSIVVPDFGRRGVRGPRVAAYRLIASGWREVSSAQLRQLLQYAE